MSPHGNIEKRAILELHVLADEALPDRLTELYRKPVTVYLPNLTIYNCRRRKIVSRLLEQTYQITSTTHLRDQTSE